MDKAYREQIDSIAQMINKIVFDNRDKNTPLSELLENIGIEVQYFVDSDISGYLRWDANQNKPVIAVNAKHSEQRRRFSMAHELGHLVLAFKWLPAPYGDGIEFDDNRILNVTKYRGKESLTANEKQEEAIVNEFAAGFLMPYDKIDELWETDGPNVELVIDKMVATFNVSEQAARVRIANYLRDRGLSIE